MAEAWTKTELKAALDRLKEGDKELKAKVDVAIEKSKEMTLEEKLEAVRSYQIRVFGHELSQK